MADLQAKVVGPLDRAGRAHRRAQPRPRHPDPAHRELHQPGGEPVGTWPVTQRRGSRRTRTRCWRSPRPRVSSARSRTTCSGSRGVLEGNDELRMALTDPSLPADRRIAVVEELMGGKALPASTVARGGDRRRRSGAASCPRSSTAFVEKAAAEREHEVAEVRSAIPLDDAQQQRLAAGAVGGHRQAGRSQGRRRRVGARGTRRPHRRHRDRRLDPSPARATQGNDLTHG